MHSIPKTEDPLRERRILLGVSGGIAAYKAPDLVRRLLERGAEVQVVMTAAACRFVTPLTFQAVSGRPVRTDLWDEEAEAAMGHIELARWAELVLVAPASADMLARLAGGLAQDLLGTLCLASEAPLVCAPAMNRAMWANAATRDNVARLTRRGIGIIGPDEGDQACGEWGAGRLAEPVVIVEELARHFSARGSLAGKTVMVTAGPTREALDPVRYLSNRSSGRMGFALARAAAEAGAQVRLVTGPVSLPAPPGVERIDVESAREMDAAVQARLESVDVFIGAAAVADYQRATPEPQKMKKGEGGLVLELERAPDVIARVGARRPRPFTVGFAAETQALEEHAAKKLEGKSLDMIAANRVGPGVGFDSDDNALIVLWPGGRKVLERAPKIDLARALIALIVQRIAAREAAA